ncbi:MAG: iron chelate uptake ABC transporter family permease subunit [Phycisphaerae bacterium]
MLIAQSITDVSFAWPSLDELARVLTLRGGFNSAIVVIGTTLLGAAAGIVGSFALLRKRALIGDALSHAALPGLAIAFLISVAMGGVGRSLPVLLTGATISGVVGVLCVQWLSRYTRLHEDAAIGAVLSVFFGFGVLLLSIIQTLDVGTQGGLHHFIYGQTAAMHQSDAILIGAVALLAVIASAVLFKEFRLVCFNDEFATVQGWPVPALDLAMMALVVIVTVIGLQSVGLILSIALLIIPAAAARFWTERLDRMIVLSGAIGAMSGYFGSCASALLPRLPAGAVIVLAAGCIFLVSFLLAPARGVLASSLRQFRLRLSIAREHVLRGMFELAEKREPGAAVIHLRDLRKAKRWLAWDLWLLGGRLRRDGLIVHIGDQYRLTTAGWREAQRVTRNHRLWEEYLITFAHLDPTHVDHCADMVEHVLDPEMIAELEQQLRRRGRLPAATIVTESVHPIAGATP